MKPFSTYPEDREKLLSLARILQTPHDVETGEKASDELSDLVLAILSDEETDQFDAELDAADLMMIEEGWQRFKNAGPVAKVINDNQPGKTAIIEILRDPPTLSVGTLLFAPLDDKAIEDGGSAFPSLVDYDGDGYPSQNSNGMSLRDWFAGQALSGMLASERFGDPKPYSEEIAADRSYRMADAMIAARKAGA